VTVIQFKRGFAEKIRKPLILSLLFATLITCIDPFNPNLKGTTSILIVDALLTNENRSYAFKLSWTSQNQNTKPVMAAGATVSLSDKEGAITNLTEVTPGVYKSDSLQFLGRIGNSYVLKIKTTDGNEYESDTCTMSPVQPIDNIYFNKDQEFINNGSEILDGIRIFIDSENEGDGKYVRWVYEEWWKFSVPEPKRFEYINKDDIRQVEQIKQVCYAYNGSDEISIKSTAFAGTNRIVKQPILFVASDQSDRLLVRYYVEIKQLSLSKTEFEFWDHMREINEGGVDIFEKQPFSVPSNIHNKGNPSELVLGYFQVSAVEPISIYITPDDIADLSLPPYEYQCDRVEKGPDDYPGARMTFDMIYASYTGGVYQFIEPIYDLRWNLIKLAFARNYCAICTNNGSLTAPDFWVEEESSQTKR
jgi:hypothetical protein